MYCPYCHQDANSTVYKCKKCGQVFCNKCADRGTNACPACGQQDYVMINDTDDKIKERLARL